MQLLELLETSLPVQLGTKGKSKSARAFYNITSFLMSSSELFHPKRYSTPSAIPPKRYSIQDKEETLRDDTGPSSSRNQDKEEKLSDIGPSSSHIQD